MNERPQSPQPVASAAVPKEEERCDPACLGIVVVWPNFFLAKVHIFIRLYMLEWWLFLTVSSTWLQEFINSSAAGSQDANSLRKRCRQFLEDKCKLIRCCYRKVSHPMFWVTPWHFIHPLCHCHCGLSPWSTLTRCSGNCENWMCHRTVHWVLIWSTSNLYVLSIYESIYIYIHIYLCF